MGVFLGMDVGRRARHGHGPTPVGKKVFDKAVPNSEPKLRAVFDTPRSSHHMTLGITCGRGGKPTPPKDSPHDFAAEYRSP
ncbi:hypothetical protein [Streptomyces sp. NPDC007346]|uniref:hypothetical protein n=1 Tax=Streptomyces sp. NPDC007346 TaxID=3154682 RepID=UPI0034519B3A